MDPLTILASTAAPELNWAEMARTVTWPGALLLIAYSPPGKALATWLQSLVKTASVQASAQTPEFPAEVAETLKEISASLKRTTDVQTKQMEVLMQLQQSLAILLDRTPRPGQMAG